MGNTVQPLGVVMFGMRGKTYIVLEDEVLIPTGGTRLSMSKSVEQFEDEECEDRPLSGMKGAEKDASGARPCKESDDNEAPSLLVMVSGAEDRMEG